MSFRAPGAGVLGPHPGFQPQHAMYAGPRSTDFGQESSSTFDAQALLATLNNTAASPQPSSEWYVNSGVSSHMSSTSQPFQSITRYPYSSSITVGNGACLPVTHTASSIIPTRYNSLLLRNVLLSPNLVENLISVRKLTCDNLVSIEFDPFGFSIKDLHTKTEMLRCDSDGDLYLLNLQPSKALHAATNNVDLWHQRLGHPGHDHLLQALCSFDFAFACNKTNAHICQACQLGKHVCFLFSHSQSSTFFPFQLLHADVWTSPVLSNSGYQYYLAVLDDFTHYTWTFPLRHKNDVLPDLLSLHS
jgi:hypothetical protein